ncbi:MAG: hypothetical protein U9Q03_03435 [Patescibacteria group bacterium]|nr:hypothetical protein [Patescibacteria group bacterium]
MFRTLKAIGRVLMTHIDGTYKENKWAGLDCGPGYRIEDLGRPAVFCLPEDKLTWRIEGRSINDMLVEFLAAEFGGFSCDTRQQFGVWRDGREIVHYDTCIVFEVSFVGKERIPKLASILGLIAKGIGEKCIYFKAGQYSALIWPTDRNA